MSRCTSSERLGEYGTPEYSLVNLFICPKDMSPEITCWPLPSSQAIYNMFLLRVATFTISSLCF